MYALAMNNIESGVITYQWYQSLAVCHKSCLLHFNPGILLASPLPEFLLRQSASCVHFSYQPAYFNVCVTSPGLRCALRVVLSLWCVGVLLVWSETALRKNTSVGGVVGAVCVKLYLKTGD